MPILSLRLFSSLLNKGGFTGLTSLIDALVGFASLAHSRSCGLKHHGHRNKSNNYLNDIFLTTIVIKHREVDVNKHMSMQRPESFVHFRELIVRDVML